jgi:hypothetical protein
MRYLLLTASHVVHYHDRQKITFHEIRQTILLALFHLHPVSQAVDQISLLALFYPHTAKTQPSLIHSRLILRLDKGVQFLFGRQ